MKYKVGDRVKIKSLEWYNESKRNFNNSIVCGYDAFVYDMSKYCGMYAIIEVIKNNRYCIDLDNAKWNWTDEMFE